MEFFDIVFTFLIALFGATLYAMLWAKVFTGDFRAVSFNREMIDVLILATLATFLYVAWRSLAQGLPAPVSRQAGRARSLLLIGLCLVLSKVFIELPLDKYLLENPSSFGRGLFLIFDAVELLGVLMMLFSFNLLNKQ